jgi:transcriptional regulator with XRE-family HTH domain
MPIRLWSRTTASSSWAYYAWVQSFALLFAKHLHQSELTQGQFAERVGVSQSAVSAILLGKRKPRYSRAETWCTALGLVGREREQVLDSMAIAAASPRVAAIVARLERRRAE